MPHHKSNAPLFKNWNTFNVFIAILGIVTLEFIALMMHIDGIALTAAIGALSALIGWSSKSSWDRR